VYDRKKRRAGQVVQEEMAAALLTATPDVVDDIVVKDMMNVAETLASGPAVASYSAELKQRQRTEDRSKGGLFLAAMKGNR